MYFWGLSTFLTSLCPFQITWLSTAWLSCLAESQHQIPKLLYYFTWATTDFAVGELGFSSLVTASIAIVSTVWNEITWPNT